MTTLLKSFLMAGAASFVATNSAVAADAFAGGDDPFLDEAPLSADELGEARGGFSIGGFKFNFGVTITPLSVAPGAGAAGAGAGAIGAGSGAIGAGSGAANAGAGAANAGAGAANAGAGAANAGAGAANAGAGAGSPVTPLTVPALGSANIPALVTAPPPPPSADTPPQQLAVTTLPPSTAAPEQTTISGLTISAPAPQQVQAPTVTQAPAVAAPPVETTTSQPTTTLTNGAATAPQQLILGTGLVPAIITEIKDAAINKVEGDGSSTSSGTFTPPPSSTGGGADSGNGGTPSVNIDNGIQTHFSQELNAFVINNTKDNVTITHKIELDVFATNFQNAVSAVSGVSSVSRATSGNTILGGLN